MEQQCQTIEEVRNQIDRIDREVVTLLAQRGRFVAQAAAFKKDSQAVRAPARVEQVIAKVRQIADETGANAQVVEQVYRAMIAGFIEAELAEHARLKAPAQ